MRLLRASRVELRGGGVPVQHEGEAAGTLGLTVADMPGPLRLVGA